MPNFATIEKECEELSRVNESFVDNFLLQYCAERESLESVFAKKLADYRMIVNRMPEGWALWLMTQFVAFRLFRANGYARTYTDHPAIRARNAKEQEFLRQQIDQPWRFGFYSVVDSPNPHFYEMTDILDDSRFPLYSPAITKSYNPQNPYQAFFLLTGANRYCRQTFGPVACFNALIPSDILFFAKQLDPAIKSIRDVPALIEKDPVPFMMLWRGGELPLAVHNKDMVILNSSEFHEENFDPEKYEESFMITNKFPLYRLALKRWSGHPHFATVYYHAKKHRLFVQAMTDRGYIKLVETFSKYGFRLPPEPVSRVTPFMLFLVKEILRRDIKLNPYEKSFAEPVSEEQKAMMDASNIFLEGVMDAVNSGRIPDIKMLARKAGIDLDTAQQLTNAVMKSIERPHRR